MTCALCRGARSLHCVQAGRHEWHDCSGCGGTGTRTVYGPADVRTHFRSLKPLRKLEREAGIHIEDTTP